MQAATVLRRSEDISIVLTCVPVNIQTPRCAKMTNESAVAPAYTAAGFLRDFLLLRDLDMGTLRKGTRKKAEKALKTA
jgi:hypothetical protein